MDAETRRAAVEEIHASALMVVLAVSGGGNAVITDLLDVPGASRTVLEVRVPYAASALAEFIGAPTNDGAVSQETAEAMARACLERAKAVAPDVDPTHLAGVACTAALVSDRPKRGDHRAHLAVVTTHGVSHRRVALDKGRLDRQGEDRVVADALLDLLLETLGELSGQIR